MMKYFENSDKKGLFIKILPQKASNRKIFSNI